MINSKNFVRGFTAIFISVIPILASALLVFRMHGVYSSINDYLVWSTFLLQVIAIQLSVGSIALFYFLYSGKGRFN